MVMDDFRKASSPFGASMGGGGNSPEFGGGSKFTSSFPPDQTIVFGSGAAANNNNSNNNFGGGGAAAPTKRGGRERSRSASPILRPPIPPSGQSSSPFGGHQQDAAAGGKAFGKSPEQQREEEAAKARRLLRFGTEFGTRAKQAARLGSTADDDETSTPIFPAAGSPFESGNRGIMSGQAKLRDSPMQAGRNEAAVVESGVVDMDAPDNMTSEPILGICPDMCPESERNERERKGDLDRFERVGGNRNQTAKDLAVKKYTRTAEKDAVLIRPLLVLEKTMGHLLSLLDRDHEDDLLAVHSFLWDRMRAVRMDLRMQHIFTEEAIVMHEQMIRFHILAMHELCEFSEGEGISEIFNAHLNIEQMNKTSVDLFQMYDDHLKEGISVPSEAEFRGYYALLKLDKHPGYNVEPAELSLDLAKMTPEIRNSQPVRFARDVARACRAGNFVAFFRLAREASYLQACLMHAHFSKLRTQALASLHSGLQKNQGIPLSTAVDWLGMEGEDIDALIKYHGFSIKYYEEAYMVKEGPFLNRNQAFPTCRAQLVEAKRSVRIVMDVQADKHLDTMPQSPGELKKIVRSTTMERKAPPSLEEATTVSARETLVQTKEEEMPDYVEEVDEQIEEEVEEIERAGVVPVVEVVRVLPEEEGKQGKKRRMDEPQFEAEEHERRRLRHEADAVARRAASQAASQAAAAEIRRKEEQRIRAGHDAEAYLGKQGIWFRKWRRRAASKALERRRKQLETEAALDNLTLGAPLWKIRVGGASVSLAQRTEYTKTLVEEQGLKLQQMWEPLDIQDLVGPIIQGLNPAAKSLAWRLVLSTPSSPSGQWVRTKVGSRRKSRTKQELTDQTQSNTSIADERVVIHGAELGNTVDFHYSARDLGGADFAMSAKVLRHGIGGLLFVMSEDDVPLKEHARLRSVLQSLPEAANVPLLILSTRPTLVDKNGVDQSSQLEISEQLKLGELGPKVSKYRVISIAERSMSSPGTNVYFSDEALREGIAWLAKLCPRQPHLRSLQVTGLVREHLDAGLKHLLGMPFSEINPEQCINLFNQAIRATAEEIASSASRLPTGSLTSTFINQKKFTGDVIGHGIRHRQGWSSKETLETLLSDLKSSVLPPFPLKHLRNPGNILSQKVAFEQLLLQYLNLVEGNSSGNLTVNWEVTRLVQRGCTIEWSESGMKLVPKWAQICQAIFAARLLILDTKPWPLVHISRMNTSSLKTHADEIETGKSKMKTSPQFSCDEQMLLDDLINGEFQRPLSVQSQLVSATEENVTEVVSPSPSQLRNSPSLQDDTLHGMHSGMQSRRESIEASNGSMLPEPVKVSTVDKYMGYRLPQDSPFEWLVERDEESQARRLRLAFTQSECSLDKMLAELKPSSADNLQARTGNGLYASQDLLPEKIDDPEVQYQPNGYLSEEGGDLEGVGDDPGSLEEANQVSTQNLLLAYSPFEELLDKMVSESSKKRAYGSEQYMADMFTPKRRFCAGVDEYQAKYQDLQSPDWSMSK
ncbi:unnamed protein product [Calypogeia fissa]